ncbi:MAG: hypothetical protein KF823_01240 [Xanthomonadales bacterium]|nr:hypothetical protein [Xanthomonadales bacterium]
MKRPKIPSIIRYVLILSMAPAPATAGSPCPALPGNPLPACLVTPAGWFYARTDQDAERLAADAALAGEGFQRHFGRAPARGAVLAVGTSGGITEAQRKVLRAAGAQWLLPWLDPDERRALRREHLRGAITRQLGELATPARVEQALTQALAASEGQMGAVEVNRGALRHEIGHLLLISGFWPDALSGPAADGAQHYGGPGPDWLDEVAAILLEDPELARSRRTALREARDGAALPPLSGFLAGDHPLRAWALTQAAARTAGAERSGETFVQVVSGEQARSLVDQGAVFYAQARGFADFLETHGGTSVFGAIATALAGGRSFDDWLAAAGPAHGLPATVAALEAAWERWLADE